MVNLGGNALLWSCLFQMHLVLYIYINKYTDIQREKMYIYTFIYIYMRMLILILTCISYLYIYIYVCVYY